MQSAVMEDCPLARQEESSIAGNAARRYMTGEMKHQRLRTLRKLSAPEFERVLREVRADITDLHLNETVFSGVVDHLARYPSLRHQFPAFFGAFYSAMRTDLIIRLGRIYDPEGTGHDS